MTRPNPNHPDYADPEDDELTALYIQTFDGAVPSASGHLSPDKSRRWQLAAHAQAVVAVTKALIDQATAAAA